MHEAASDALAKVNAEIESLEARQREIRAELDAMVTRFPQLKALGR